ncbi:MAG: 1-acyl-sn-glycerol-3-phosphate acyltransferase [Elusimicrobia bacterium]|nr:1-acyl-sn-glycerol-3-phosphate acyltransferase [Elusimicrobiota bacterium]
MNILQWLFFVVVVRPLAHIVMGMNIRHRERLPVAGPAIVVANHNSHLDALVLMTLFPLRLLPRLRPVAAADYFCRGGFRESFARKIIHIIPLERHPQPGKDPFVEVDAALTNGDIVILFPEGTRGKPETLKELRSGIAHLAKRHPAVPIVPVFLHGLGKALPPGEALLVPFFCDVFFGDPLAWAGDRDHFMRQLEATFHTLADEGHRPDWT